MWYIISLIVLYDIYFWLITKLCENKSGPSCFLLFCSWKRSPPNKKVNERGTKKVWNMFKVNKGTRTNDIIYVMLVSLLLTLNKFTPFSSVPFVDFEQIDLWWERFLFKVSNKRLDQCNECRTWLLSGVIIVNFEQIYYKNSA